MPRHVPETFSIERKLARVVWSGAAFASLVLSGCTRDTVGPVEPGGRAAVTSMGSKAAVTLGSLSPAPASGLSTRTSPESTTEWTNLGKRLTPEEFSKVAELRVRAAGKVEIKNNPPFEAYYCIEKKAREWYFHTSSACHWSGLGSYGLTGSGGHLRIEFRVLKEDGTNELLPVFGPDSTGAYSLGMDTPGQVQMRRYALRGMAAWTGHPTIPMYTFSDGRNVTLEMVPKTEAALIAECMGDLGKDMITRGQEITCIARKDPENAPGELKVNGWSFDGEPRTDGDPTSVTWKGVMVEGGVVEVKGRIGSEAEQTARATIQVEDRDWSGKEPLISVKEVRGGEDPRMGLLPSVPFWADELGYAKFFNIETAGSLPEEPVAEVQSGPNSGRYYFPEGTQFPVYARYVLNTAAMASGSEFARLQESGGGGNRIGGINWCSRTVVPGLLDLVRAHELKHIEVYAQTYKQELSAHAVRLEAMSSRDASELLDAYDSVYRIINPTAHEESNSIHQKTGNPFRVTPRDGEGDCVLRNAQGQELTNRPEN